MRQLKKNTFSLFTAICAIFVATTLIGCGDDNASLAEDKATTEKRVDSAKELRSYYDKSGGNFDALTEEDKKKVISMTGGTEENARKAFGYMQAPSGVSGSTAK